MNRLKQQLSIVYFFGKDKIRSLMYTSPTVLSNEETIDTIINNQCSVSRFGDGEFHLLIQSKDLKFQKRSDLLSERFKEILKCQQENLLVCIPKIFKPADLNIRTKESKAYWTDHAANYRMQWYKYLDLNKTYYNASFTRNYIAVKDKSKSEEFFQKIKKIWNHREVLIIEGEYSRIGVGNNLLDNARSVERILAPSEHAFEKYDDILNAAKRHTKEKLILIALGPTATVLSYDLHIAGFQAIDIGHLDVEFEWFLQKTSVRTKIANKYVIEANQQISEDDQFHDEEYKNQIMRIIS